MIDVSDSDIEDNIKITNMVVKKAKNIVVESEIGKIKNNSDIDKTDLDTVLLFDKKAKFDTLAPAIGNFHGLKKVEPQLDFDLLESIYKSCKKPLVLHGGTNISGDSLKKCITYGVAKINFNTELQDAWAKAIKEFIKNNPNVIDPRKIIGSGEASIKEVVATKINILGSANRG